MHPAGEGQTGSGHVGFRCSGADDVDLTITHDGDAERASILRLQPSPQVVGEDPLCTPATSWTVAVEPLPCQRHRGPRAMDEEAHLHAIGFRKETVVVNGAARDADSVAAHRHLIDAMEVAALAEGNRCQPKAGDIEPIAGGDARHVGTAVKVPRPPPFTSVLRHDRRINHRGPLHEPHRRSNAVEVSDKQVIDRDSKRWSQPPSGRQVDLLHVGHEPIDERHRGFIVQFEHGRQIQIQIVLEELEVLGLLHLRQSTANEESVDPSVDLNAALNVADLVASLGDGRLVTQPIDIPAVHGLRDRRDPLRSGHGLEREKLILEQQPFRKPNAIAPQEVCAVDLIDGDRVEQQLREVTERLHDNCRVMYLRSPSTGTPSSHIDALGCAAHDIRARCLRRCKEVLAGVTLVLIVRVAEHHPRRAGQLDPPVARRTAAARVHLESLVPHARVSLGDTAHDLLGAIGRCVIDDDDLEGAQGLTLDRCQSPWQSSHIVVRDDDDRDVRSAHRRLRSS